MLKPVVKKSILAAALAFVLAVLIEFGAVSGNPRAVSFQFDGQAVSASVPPSEVEYERYTVEQGVFTPSGEDPQLSMDMATAIVNAWQSSYDEEGNAIEAASHAQQKIFIKTKRPLAKFDMLRKAAKKGL